MKVRASKKDRIQVVTLGCSKNTVDSEILIKQLTAHGVDVVYDQLQCQARTVIINTCGFIQDSKKESVDTILHYAQYKMEGVIDRLFVMGCLAERYKKDLIDSIPEVDQFFGVNDIQVIIKAIGYNFREDLLGQRTITTPPHYAYLKIAEGCNRHCSFCSIPKIRGNYHSKSIKELISEAKSLVNGGVKELLLIAQDLSYYGYDLYDEHKLYDLVKDLTAIEQIEWIKLHYTYPQNFPLKILDLMRTEEKLCHYLDMPFQHICDKLLKLMKRGHDSKLVFKLIDLIRSKIPDLALRTTLIIGFPGETEVDFKNLIQFVKDIKFDRLGVFAYSHEQNTWAGEHLKDTIPDKVKKERIDEIMQLQQAISLELNGKKIGKKLKVIIDNNENHIYFGRTQYDSPEVDNEVRIETDKKLTIGKFYDVLINKATAYDLIGFIEN